MLADIAIWGWAIDILGDIYFLIALHIFKDILNGGPIGPQGLLVFGGFSPRPQIERPLASIWTLKLNWTPK